MTLHENNKQIDKKSPSSVFIDFEVGTSPSLSLSLEVKRIFLFDRKSVFIWQCDSQQ
jgi:hypothetical protein